MTPDNEPIPEDYYLKYDGPDEFVNGEPEFVPREEYEEIRRELSEKREVEFTEAAKKAIQGTAAANLAVVNKELKEENTRLRKLIEKAFVSGRSRTTWEQFKKDNGL